MNAGNLFVAAVGFSVLAGCASSAPPISTESGTHPEKVPATAYSASLSTAPAHPNELKDEKYSGYQVVGDGDQKRYCRTEYFTGSRVDKTTRCFTKEQLESQQNKSRDMIQGLQNASAFGQPCTSGQGGGAAGCQ